MKATLATSPTLPVEACKWKVRMVPIANVDVVVRGIRNPLRTYLGCQIYQVSRMAETNQYHDHYPL